MAIERLGHTGLWVEDLAPMVDFYTRVVRLHVTDQDHERGMVFLSSHPDEEHHELVLQQGRTASRDDKLLHQISWRVDSLDALRSYHREFQELSVDVQQVVTHGNALGIYFFDPEGNRNEVYWVTGEDVPQPYRRSINLDQEPDEILEEAARILRADGETYEPVQ